MRFRFHGSWLGKSTWQVDLASRLINNLRKKKTVASFVDSFHVSWTCFQRRISLVSSINHILYLVLPSFTFSIVFFLLSLVFTLLSRVVSSWKRVVVLYRPPSLTYLFFFSKCFQKIIFFPPFSSTIRRRQPSPASARSSGDKCDGDLDLVVFLFFFLSFQCRRFLSLFRARRRSDGRALAVALIAVAPRDPQPIKWRCGRYRTAIGSIIEKKTHTKRFSLVGATGFVAVVTVWSDRADRLLFFSGRSRSRSQRSESTLILNLLMFFFALTWLALTYKTYREKIWNVTSFFYCVLLAWIARELWTSWCNNLQRQRNKQKKKLFFREKASSRIGSSRGDEAERNGAVRP